MIGKKITKEEVNQLPLVLFDGTITVVDQVSQIKPAIEELRKHSIVGLDTETKPSFTRGTHHKVSLVQLSTLNHCFLFRLNFIDFPQDLADFFADEKITKIGLSLRDDFVGLNKRHTFKPVNFIDIQSIIQDYGILELSLQKIYALLFNKKISKSQRLTNWEQNDLSEQQLRYAATDAWASLQIYLHLMSLPKLTKKEISDMLTENTLLQRKLREENPTRNTEQSEV